MSFRTLSLALRRYKRFFATILVVPVAVLTLAGCTQVGPDFVQPDADIPAAWDTADSNTLKPESTELVEWWQAFNDPVLNKLITTAYDQNLTLEAAGLRVLEARAQLGIAVGNIYPQQQSAGGGATYTGRSENAPNTSGGDLNYWQYDAGINIGWEPDFWGRFRRGIESADASLLTSVAAYDTALVLLIAQVADTYIVIRSTEAQLRISKQNLKLQQRSYKITEVLFRNGEQSELDMQQAKTLLLSTQASIPGLEITLDQSSNALSTLLGQPPGDLLMLLTEKSAIPVAPAEVAVGIPADLLRRRPDVRQAQLQAATQSALIGVATADLYPSFTLTGSLGLVAAAGTNTTRTGNTGFNELFDSDSLQFTGGPAFSWKLFNYGRLKNNIRVQDARFQQTVVNYQSTVLSAAGEVENAITGYVRGRRQEKILAETVTSAQRSSDLSLLRYTEGFADYQRVLDAQQSLFNQQQRYITSKSNTVRSLVALYKSLGGGWQIRGDRDFVDTDTRDEMAERTDWGELLETDAVKNAEKTDATFPKPDW
jgi:NodT family efflux transporter outer membrane factor (OMF) lipoprotein